MQTWDYCTFWCDELAEYGYVTVMGGNGPHTDEVRPAGREDFLKFKVRILAGLGAEGWEMVGVSPSVPQGKTLYFKRPSGGSATAK
ncbi:MAG TPA: hypothetical protein VGA61_03410 [Anaerolineae bacterium]